MHIESTHIYAKICSLKSRSSTATNDTWTTMKRHKHLTIITRSSVHVLDDHYTFKCTRCIWQPRLKKMNGRGAKPKQRERKNEVLRSRLADTGRLVPAWIRDKFTRIQENQEVEKTMYETSKARSGNCAASKIRSTVFSIFYMNVKIIEAHASRRRTTARRASRAPRWTRNRCAHVNMSSQSLQSINRQTAIEDFIQWHLLSRQP